MGRRRARHVVREGSPFDWGWAAAVRSIVVILPAALALTIMPSASLSDSESADTPPASRTSCACATESVYPRAH